MADEQQSNGSNGAGGNVPPPTPNDSANQIDWKAQAETWQTRYNGQQTAMNKKSDEVKSWQQKYAELSAELEGYKGTTTTELTDWQKKHQTLEQQVQELSKKTAQYERQDKIRSLIHSDFADLAPEFEADPIYRAGILSAAEQMDEAGLKTSLAKSLELRKGQRQAAAEGAVTGATSAPPSSGAAGSGAMTEDQVVDQLRNTPLNDPKRPLLMKQWQELLDKKNR